MSINDILSVTTLDKGNVVGNDSHYLTVKVDKAAHLSREEHSNYFYDVYDEIMDSTLNPNIYIINNPYLVFNYSGFSQVNNISFKLINYNFVPLDFLEIESLIYGKMPEKPNEIIIDLQVAKRFFNDNPMLSILYGSPESLVGKEVKIKSKNFPFKIVGISNTYEAAIYIDKIEGLGTYGWFSQLSSLSKLKYIYPKKYRNLNLNQNEILISNKYENIKKNMFHVLSQDLKIVGELPEDFNTKFIINDKNYSSILRDICCYKKSFNIYTNNKQQFINFFNNISNQSKYENVNIHLEDPYKNDLSNFEKQKSIQINSKTIILFSIFLVCLVFLYFIMKSHTINYINDIAVFRLLGIKKSCITKLFVIENIIISSYTSLVGVLITSLAYKFLANINSLQLLDVMSWYVILLIIIGLYVLNIIIGLLPILRIVKLMPAQITAKYDI